MIPTLMPGRFVLATGWYGLLRKGDVIIFSHSGMEKIKRITDMKDGEVFVAGDNTSESTDSHDFGWIGRESVVAKVILPRM